jgi:hypothetical protein
MEIDHVLSFILGFKPVAAPASPGLNPLKLV